MPHVQRSVYLHYSAEQMFDLVEDVESYPQFLPWCSGSRIVADHEGGVDASIDIAYKGIRSRFTTRNQHRYPEQIRLELIDGPFRSLTGHWDFLPLRAGACKVQLTLQYEFVERPARPGRGAGLRCDRQLDGGLVRAACRAVVWPGLNSASRSSTARRAARTWPR